MIFRAWGRWISASALLLVTARPATPAGATLPVDSTCTVSALNRTITANDDGTWTLNNVPAGLGKIRVRATCIRAGATLSGESDLFDLPANGDITLPPIYLGSTTPVPVSLQIATPSTTLSAANKAAQLTVTATFADNSTRAVSTASSGTTYLVSNPATATISADGLITAIASGTVIVQALNEGATGLIQIKATLSADSDGDGIPDDIEVKLGMNPNDPADAMQDWDHDGLTNLQEYLLGTDPKNPDTDGDGLKDGDEVRLGTNPLIADTDGDGVPDGLEVQLGTDPLSPQSVNLTAAVSSLRVTPALATLTVNSFNPTASMQLKVLATLVDGSTLNATAKKYGTQYSSSDLTICNFGSADGEIFAGQPGACIITVTLAGRSVPVPIRVVNFNPTELSILPIPGILGVDVAGNFAYVITDSSFVVVDVSDRTQPHIRGTVNVTGDLRAVRISTQYAYVTDGSGWLRVFQISNPATPTLVASLPLSGSPRALRVHLSQAMVGADSGAVQFIDLSTPTAPRLHGSVLAASGVLGIDFDSAHGLAVIGMGNQGMQMVDISNPSAPRLRGRLSGGFVHGVLMRFPAILLADSIRSVSSVDTTNPDQPVLVNSLPGTLGGGPVDIAVFGDYAITADQSFGRAVPIVNVIDPLNPATLAYWPLNPAGYSASVAMDATYGYLADITGARLRIGQYQSLNDTLGVAPLVSFLQPAPGTNLIARASNVFRVGATDDVAVALVQFLVNGQVVGTSTQGLTDFSYTIPKGTTQLTVSARAYDLGGNVGITPNLDFSVVVGPLTTVTGSGVDTQGAAVSNASLQIVNEFLGMSNPDGSFSIPNVPAALGQLRVYGQAMVGGVLMHARSNLVNTVPNGITNAGTLVYQIDADSDGIPDAYEVAHSCMNPTVADDDADTDGDGFSNIQEYLLGTDPCIANLAIGRNETNSVTYSVQVGPPVITLPAGLYEADSSTYSLLAGSQPTTIPAGLNEVDSPIYSLGFGGSTTLPAGLNEAFSQIYSLNNGGSPSSTLPAGSNEILSNVYALYNGNPPPTSLSSGFNESVSSIYSLLGATGERSRTSAQSQYPATTSAAHGGLPLTLSAPADQLFEGQTVAFRLPSPDEGTRSVEYLADGVSLGVVAESPFEMALTLPANVPRLQIRAIARNEAGVGMGFAVADLDVGPSDHQTVRGRVVASSGRLEREVTVHAFYQGFYAEYFDFETPLLAIPELDGRTPTSRDAVTALNVRNPDQVFGTDPLGTGMLPDFAARFSGFLQVLVAGGYRFYLRGREGARLTLGGRPVLELPGGETVREASGDIQLPAGLVPIEIVYYAASGGEEIDLSYAGTGFGRRAIPQSLLWAEWGKGVPTSAGAFHFDHLPVSIGSIEVAVDDDGEAAQAEILVTGNRTPEFQLKLHAKEK